ncbi:MAG TPA: hypothetical protein VK508_05250 [Cyclobacteriaceae bacterium]|nr:hypothetical protein [Cyclobacteriaceae bacterium]
MYKRILPVFILSGLLVSCGSQQTSESTANADTAGVATPPDSTQEEGDPDGDIFVTDGLKNAISGETEQPDTVSEYGTEEKEELEERVGPSESLAEIRGFSADGKYFAFVQVERGDGYTDPSGKVYVIDVEKNEWATRPVTYGGDGLDEDFDTKLNETRDKVLKKYGFAHPPSIGYEYRFIGVNPNNVVLINEQRYVLDFKSNNGMIDLRVKGQGKDILLQKDSKVPASRGVVRRCRLNKAYVLGDRIAVFVEYDGNIEEGFEASRYYSRKNIVVTGVVK